MPQHEDRETLVAYQRGVDVAARDAEAVWGFGRLPDLVSSELRAKFRRQGARWRAALEEAWETKMLTRAQLDAVISAAGGMERAWKALDAAAREAGHKPVDPDVWECELSDGSVVAIVRTGAEVPKVIAGGRLLTVWTVADVAAAIEHMPEAIRKTKTVFPGATIRPPRDRVAAVLDDPIPF